MMAATGRAAATHPGSVMNCGASCVDGPRLARDSSAYRTEVACSHVSALPRLDIPPNRFLPPVEFWRGTRPSHAANSRPLRKPLGSATIAAIAVAMMGPMPGIVAKRWLTGLLLCQPISCFSSAAIAASSCSICTASTCRTWRAKPGRRASSSSRMRAIQLVLCRRQHRQVGRLFAPSLLRSPRAIFLSSTKPELLSRELRPEVQRERDRDGGLAAIKEVRLWRRGALGGTEARQNGPCDGGGAAKRALSSRLSRCSMCGGPF